VGKSPPSGRKSPIANEIGLPVFRRLVPAQSSNTALKVLLDESGTEVYVELYQW
jgi:hypothetical protein